MLKFQAIFTIITSIVFISGHAQSIDQMLENSVKNKTFSAIETLAGNINGRVYFHKRVGQYSFQSSHNIKSNSLFDIASISKVYTAIAIMNLISHKKLNLKTTLKDLLGNEVPVNKRGITIEMLLRHRSGLHPLFILPNNELTGKKMIRHLLRYKMVEDYDQKIIYSDTGYVLLANIVSMITRTSFYNYLETIVFKQTNSLASHAHIIPRNKKSHYVLSNSRNDFKVHDPRAYLMEKGAGHAGVFSNVTDIKNMINYLLTSEIGYKMMKPGPLRTRGLGLDINGKYSSPIKGHCFKGRSVSHSGYTGTSFIADPDTGDYLIILSNRTLSPLTFSQSIRNLNSVRRKLADEVCKY